VFNKRLNKINMKIFPTGKDAKFYYQLILAGTAFVVFKLLRENYPFIANLFGLISIVVLIVYFVVKAVKKRKLNTPQVAPRLNIKSPKLGLILLTIIILSLMSFGFYWFELRPANVRIECSKTAKDKANQTKDPIRAYGTYYELCIHNKGL
jgi:hypothetical protein